MVWRPKVELDCNKGVKNRDVGTWVRGYVGTWVRGYVVRGTWYVVRGTWYVVRGTWYVVRGTWYVVRGTWTAEAGHAGILCFETGT